jgi:FtsP/CotA-like multicopper oxidase with cupredoxin domain
VPNSRDFDHTDKVMQFEVTADAFDAANNEVPAELNPQNEIMLLDETQFPGIKTVKLELHRSNSTWKVNNTTWDDIVASNYQTVVANPQPDEVQIWEITNKSGGWFHPTHIHLVDFKILSRNGKPPYNYELGPKDVAYVGENESVRLITRFAHQTGRYMIHCHNLPHEDHDMMTQFRVGADTPDNDPMTSAPAGPIGSGNGATVIPVANFPTTATPTAPTTPTTTGTTTTTTTRRRG